MGKDEMYWKRIRYKVSIDNKEMYDICQTKLGFRWIIKINFSDNNNKNSKCFFKLIIKFIKKDFKITFPQIISTYIYFYIHHKSVIKNIFNISPIFNLI